MKKVNAIFISCVLCVSYVNAQVVDRVGVSFGATSSILEIKQENINSGNVSDLYDRLIGKQAFVWTDFFQHKRFRLNCNLGYLEKGGSQDFVFTDSQGTVIREFKDAKLAFDYLSINIGLKSIFKFRNFEFQAIVGPRLDYLLNVVDDLNTTNPYADLASSTNFGVFYDVGFVYNINDIWGIDFRARSNQNFNKIIDTEPTATSFGVEAQDYTMLYSLGVSYRLFKEG